MGVSGSGKSTVGILLAQALGEPFCDADDLHPAENVAKMASGIPLTEADREPWLDAIARWLATARQEHRPGVLACSALKRRYRDRFREAEPDLRLVYLHGSAELITARMRARIHHFFPAALLESQLAALEEPTADEHPLTVPIGGSADSHVTGIVAALPELPPSQGLA
jgi:gluconokinase